MLVAKPKKYNTPNLSFKLKAPYIPIEYDQLYPSLTENLYYSQHDSNKPPTALMSITDKEIYLYAGIHKAGVKKYDQEVFLIYEFDNKEEAASLLSQYDSYEEKSFTIKEVLRNNPNLFKKKGFTTVNPIILKDINSDTNLKVTKF